jgi:probable rRNA maturation factor
MAIHIKNQQRSKNLNLRRVRKDLTTILSLLGQEESELSILFVGSLKMKTLNTRYRGIPKETDVLSFPMNEVPAFLPGASRFTPYASRSLLLGDIVISIPKTQEQARTYRAPFYEELLRLLIHGLLHLLGYDHEGNRYQKARMERKEKEILHAIAHMA